MFLGSPIKCGVGGSETCHVSLVICFQTDEVPWLHSFQQILQMLLPHLVNLLFNFNGEQMLGIAYFLSKQGYIFVALIIPLMLPLDVAHVYIVRFMPKRDACC